MARMPPSSMKDREAHQRLQLDCDQFMVNCLNDCDGYVSVFDDAAGDSPAFYVQCRIGLCATKFLSK
jgi:hypothetical protein